MKKGDILICNTTNSVWDIKEGEVVIAQGDEYYRNGEHEIETDKGVIPTVFLRTRKGAPIIKSTKVAPTIKSIKINFTYKELRLMEIALITRITEIEKLLRDVFRDGDRMHKVYTLELKECQVMLNKIVIYFKQIEI